MLAELGDTETAQQLMVLGVKTAIWTLPNTREERRYLVGWCGSARRSSRSTS